MAFLIGRKVKMEQQWNENGKVVPVTIVEAGPVVVTQVKTKDKDGYEAFQVGYDSSVKRIAKAQAGHLKQLGKFRFMREFKKAGDMNFAVGDTLDVSAFEKGDKVKVTGQDKGRGFQGVVKRHGFHGGPKTHGQKNRLRAPGSLGATAPQRVLKGRKMAGRMGNETVTLRKLPIVQVDKEKNLLYIKGPVPGTKKGILLIEKM
jgi:large subunit ribosomal protein L3